MEEVKEKLGELDRSGIGIGVETVTTKGRSSEGKVCSQADMLDWRIQKMTGWLVHSLSCLFYELGWQVRS